MTVYSENHSNAFYLKERTSYSVPNWQWDKQGP